MSLCISPRREENPQWVEGRGRAASFRMFKFACHVPSLATLFYTLSFLGTPVESWSHVHSLLPPRAQCKRSGLSVLPLFSWWHHVLTTCSTLSAPGHSHMWPWYLELGGFHQILHIIDCDVHHYFMYQKQRKNLPTIPWHMIVLCHYESRKPCYFDISFTYSEGFGDSFCLQLWSAILLHSSP